MSDLKIKAAKKSLGETLKSHWKVLEFDVQASPRSFFFPVLSGGKYSGEGGRCSAAKETDPQPQEHQLVQAAL